MKQISLVLITILTLTTVYGQNSFYDYTTKTLSGQDFKLSDLKGKKVMVVNTASKCGLTPQYKDLQALYEKYGNSDFVIIGFPANNFLSQEPGTNEEIAEFCEVNYGVTFPMMSKISVKGKDQDPIYKWLTEKELNGKLDSEVQWNFQKYFINEDGEFAGMLEPKEKPDSQKVIDWIEDKKPTVN
jgi:glutathione peroxidase